MRAWTLSLGLGVPAIALGATPSIDAPPITGATAPNDYAVVIANEDYTGFGRVSYARRDADAFAAWLTRTRGVKSINVARYENESRTGIQVALEDAAKKVGDGGTLWVYYAGHGLGLQLAGASAPEQVLLGINAISKANELPDYVVPVAALQKIASGSRAAQAVFVLDACFNNAGRDGAALVEGRFAVPTGKLVAATKVTVWSATDSNETALPYGPAQHGAFTYFAVGALSGWADGVNGAPDGQITLDEASEWVGRAMTSAGIRGQNPRLAGAATLTAVNAKGKLAAEPTEFPRVGAAPRVELPVADTGDDYIAKFAAAQAEQKRVDDEKRRLEADQARLVADHKSRVDQRVKDVTAQAAAEWAKAKPIRDGGGKAAKELAAAFLSRWAGRVETVDGEKIPIDVQDLLTEARWFIVEGGGYLGVAVSLDPNTLGGALLTAVTAGSPAAVAGLAPNDVLLAVDGSKVSTYDDVIARVGATRRPGETVTLTLRRGTTELTRSVTLAERPPEAAPAPATWPTPALLLANERADVRSAGFEGSSMRAVRPDKFVIASEIADPVSATPGIASEAHFVTLTQGYLLGTTEVTEADWSLVDPNTPRVVTVGETTPVPPGYPATFVSWCDAVWFANEVSVRDGLQKAYSGVEKCSDTAGTSVKWNRKADGYRLPTEAEWEYAARQALPATWLDMGMTPTDARIEPVGLHVEGSSDWFDLYGNVDELTWDGYAPYGSKAETDPTGPKRAKSRTLRGGEATETRAALWRNEVDVFSRRPTQGLRLARNLPAGMTPAAHVIDPPPPPPPADVP